MGEGRRPRGGGLFILRRALKGSSRWGWGMRQQDPISFAYTHSGPGIHPSQAGYGSTSIRSPPRDATSTMEPTTDLVSTPTASSSAIKRPSFACSTLMSKPPEV